MWNRDLATGLCVGCARRTARERKETQKSVEGTSAPVNEEDLKQKLEKLKAQGSLTNEDLTQLKGGLQEQKSSTKVFWLRIGLVCLAISGAVKSCQLMKRTDERNALMVNANQRPKWDKLGIRQGADVPKFVFHKPPQPWPQGPKGVSVDEIDKAVKHNRIQAGLTLKEVEAILGPAAETQMEDVRQADGSASRQAKVASWIWPERSGLPAFGDQPKRQPWIRVHFKDGKVTCKEQVKSKR